MNSAFCTLHFALYNHADVVKLADTIDLGSIAHACRFKSCHPHHKTTLFKVVFASKKHWDKDLSQEVFMLIIRSLFYQVTIPDNVEYAIYTNDYFLDKDGNLVTEIGRTDVYDYGDLIIQTGSAKYIFKKVYSAYDYAVRIMEHIKAHREDKVIYINMEELNEFWDEHPERLRWNRFDRKSTVYDR